MAYIKARDRRKGVKPRTCHKWQLVVSNGFDSMGKRIELSRSFNGTESQARTAAGVFEDEVRRGRVAAPNGVTVGEAGLAWLALRKLDTKPLADGSSALDPGTLDYYTYLFEVHIMPALGASKIRNLSEGRAHDFFEELRFRGSKRRSKTGQPLSITTVKQVRFALKAICEHARRKRWCSENVVLHTRLPNQKASKTRIIDRSEMAALLSAARGTYLFLPILIAIVTGARRGEIFALKWKDIDSEVSSLSVRRSLRRDLSLKGPKTSSGNREFPLPLILLEEIAKHFESYKKSVLTVDLDSHLFVDDDGQVIKPNSISTFYRSLVKKAAIGHVRFHDLRHSVASLMVDDGVPIPEVAHLLGHADKAFTYRRYVHKTAGENPKRAQSMVLNAETSLRDANGRT